jgi:hypothetical protein
MIITYSGIRDISEDSYNTIYQQVASDLSNGATELRFGGALGVDTVALEAAYRYNVDAKLRVFVPWKLRDQPAEARRTVQLCADEVVELQLPRVRWAPLERNVAMLLGRGARSDRLVAFKDDRCEGGTFRTIERANQEHIACQVVPVFSCIDPW